MGKLDVVLIVLNNNSLEQSVRTLNLKKTNLIAILVENAPVKSLRINGREIPLVLFSQMQELLNAGKNFVWLINGFQNVVSDIWRMKKFLMNNGVPEDNIVNFEILFHTSVEWLANLRYIEKYGADFFATGISYTKVGLDLNFIPCGKGVHLAGSNQDLRQGYLTAKYVFEHVAPGTVKLVIIGLAPYSFRYSNTESFSVCPRNLQYILALGNSNKKTLHDLLLEILVGDNVKNIFTQVTERQADLNFDRLKQGRNKGLSAKAVINWEAELNNLTKKHRPQVIQANFQILKDYIELCLANGAKPVGVVFPFAPAMRKNYDQELLRDFRAAIRRLEESYDFKCVDMFDFRLDYDCFYNMAHLNLNGAFWASLLLSAQLYERNILPTENFCDMNYYYFDLMANFEPLEIYNSFIGNVFKKSAEMIRRKNKIKVGFVLYDSSLWCGDDLYNCFAADSRFEPTIFLCLRIDYNGNELTEKDFWNGVEQFRSRGLNVVAVSDANFPVPTQDVLIFLTPYFEVLPLAFQSENISAKTLLTYIPYGFNMTAWNNYNTSIYHVAWKIFFDTQFHVNLLQEECQTGMSRGLYSGYPKLDAFYKDSAALKFDWKSTRPNAKKIIYAPHWTMNNGIMYSTFHWNYRFMYEFAKAHKEISWVFKPHPNLFLSAVQSGLFPSLEAFEEYLQLWNDLPNAQVCTGAYYQELFATSDGIIHDCGSFIAEYQYTHKPTIFLTRETQKFNELGNAVMETLYRVDGRDLNGIAALIQKVFIEGDDYKAVERKDFFDKYFNYFAHNGMSASEFIYRNISGELKINLFEPQD